jgi:hypothetical protein
MRRRQAMIVLAGAVAVWCTAPTLLVKEEAEAASCRRAGDPGQRLAARQRGARPGSLEGELHGQALRVIR